MMAKPSEDGSSSRDDSDVHHKEERAHSDSDEEATVEKQKVDESRKASVRLKRSFDVAFLAGSTSVSGSPRGIRDVGSDDSDGKSAFSKVHASYAKQSRIETHNNNESHRRTVPNPLSVIPGLDSSATVEQTRSNLFSNPLHPQLALMRGINPGLFGLSSIKKLIDSSAPTAIPQTNSSNTSSSVGIPPASVLAPPIGVVSAALGLTSVSNTCAKCGITFRMTSDLVYHMRTHHSRQEKETFEKRRDYDRLKCPVCGENFKERHHLTRHMTAHQEKGLTTSQTQGLQDHRIFGSF